MKQCLIDVNSPRLRFATALITLLFIVCAVTINLLMLPDTAVAFQVSRTTQIPSPYSHATLLLTVAASPTASNSTGANGAITSSQNSQAQNDLSVANNISNHSGVLEVLPYKGKPSTVGT